jgi:ApbE superfamily uncharacterized protein (UPF0280 family)
MNGPLRARFADGRWHFQHGPIDLVIGASGAPGAVAAALEDCWVAFGEVLPALVAELAQLRSPCTPTLQLRGPVARMAAVAGAVADHLIGWLRRPGVARAYINNGGDIALHLTDGESFDIGLIADIDAPRLDGSLRIDSGDPVRGVATSGWRGRSFSFGIADRVTVLAADAAAADAAATMIANHVDVAAPGIERAPADSLRDDTDLGSRLVTVRVPPLPAACIDAALERGAAFARQCLARGLIQAALLTVQGRSRMLAAQPTTALA